LALFGADPPSGMGIANNFMVNKKPKAFNCMQIEVFFPGAEIIDYPNSDFKRAIGRETII
jgi:hypothetical protein